MRRVLRSVEVGLLSLAVGVLLLLDVIFWQFPIYSGRLIADVYDPKTGGMSAIPISLSEMILTSVAGLACLGVAVWGWRSRRRTIRL